MMTTDLAVAAQALVFGGRGLLSLDAGARAHRELPITAPGIERYVGGMVLDDATIRRSARGGRRAADVLRDRGILPGVSVGLCDGLSTLPWRLAEYAALGAGFATCRAALRIESGVGAPADRTMASNAHALARFAAACQANGIVPIVACDVLADGDHSLARCEDATARVLRRTFAALADAGVVLEAMVLAVNMVTPGLASSQRAEIADVVDARSVDEHHRPERRHLDRLLDRIGRRARDLGDDRHREAEERVHEARLANVAPAEEADVHAPAFWRVEHGFSAFRWRRGPARRRVASSLPGTGAGRARRRRCGGSRAQAP